MGMKSFLKNIFSNPNKQQQQQYYQDSLSARAGSSFVASEKNIIKIPEFMSAIDMIANDIADVKFYDSKMEFTSKFKTPYNKIVDTNWNVLLNKRPNDFQSSVEFWKNNIFNLITRGAFFFYIYKDSQGRPKEFVPIHPNSIIKAKTKDGKYFYRVTLFENEYAGSQSTGTVDIPYEDVFSLYWFDMENINDLEFRTAYASMLEQLGLSNEYDLTQLNQSPRILAHVKTVGKIDEDQRKELKSSMQSFFTNAKKINSSAVLVTDERATLELVNKDKTQVQSPLTKEFTTKLMVKLANAFHIPLPKLNIVDTGQSFYKSREGINIDYISEAIRPIAVKIVSKLSALIYPKSTKRLFTFKLDKLLMVDHATRGEYTSKLVQSGIISQNEARILNGLPPVPNGDEIYGNGTLIPMDSTRKGGENEEPN